MRIGIIGGTGPAGSGLALRMSVAGHQVLIGSRSKERSEEKVAELIAQWPDHKLKIETGTNEDAAHCDLIVVATPWDSTATIVGEYADALRGKVVVTMANALGSLVQTEPGKPTCLKCSVAKTSQLQAKSHSARAPQLACLPK
jgi:predicted dinucleotide-binding enzyme